MQSYSSKVRQAFACRFSLKAGVRTGPSKIRTGIIALVNSRQDITARKAL